MGKSKWDILSISKRLLGSNKKPESAVLKRNMSTSSQAAAAEQDSSPAYKYLSTFSDYQAPYMQWIKRHESHFRTTSDRFEYYVVTNKINTSDLSALRQAYKYMASEQNQHNQTYCVRHKIGAVDQQSISYLGRLALQFATRAMTFKVDPLAVHRIHASMRAKGLPALGRLPEHIIDPVASAARTRSDADLAATIKIQPKSIQPECTFFADDKGTSVTKETTITPSKPTK